MAILLKEQTVLLLCPLYGGNSSGTHANSVMSHWFELQQKKLPLYTWLALSIAHPMGLRGSQLSLKYRSLRKLDKVKALPARKNLGIA